MCCSIYRASDCTRKSGGIHVDTMRVLTPLTTGLKKDVHFCAVWKIFFTNSNRLYTTIL